jgi:hypothetical protein
MILKIDNTLSGTYELKNIHEINEGIVSVTTVSLVNGTSTSGPQGKIVDILDISKEADKLKFIDYLLKAYSKDYVNGTLLDNSTNGTSGANTSDFLEITWYYTFEIIKKPYSFFFVTETNTINLPPIPSTDINGNTVLVPQPSITTTDQRQKTGAEIAASTNMVNDILYITIQPYYVGNAEATGDLFN